MTDSGIERDEKNLKTENDIRFITAIYHLKCKAEIMFNFARMILAEDKSPEEADTILHSDPLPHITPYDEAIRMNPNRKVSFVENNAEDNPDPKNKED